MKQFLTGLLVIVFISSVLFGCSMIIQPNGHGLGISVNYLKSTPFSSYFLPGILLVIAISSTSFYALMQLLKRKHKAIPSCFTAGIFLSIWVIAQMLLIPGAAGISILYILIALLIILTSAQLRGIELL